MSKQGYAMNEMASVQFDRNADRQCQLCMAAYDLSVSGDRTNEVATHRDKYLRNAVPHRCDGFDGMMTVFTARLRIKHIANAVQILLRWLFIDADRPVPLDVRMATNRRNAAAGLSEIAAEQQQIHQLLQ
jgi:hypothetical protein